MWPNFEIPPIIKSVLETGGYGDTPQQEGGDDAISNSQLQNKLRLVAESAKTVQVSETNLQMNYWKIRNKFRPG